jgi:hypothetical protein
LGIDAEAFGIFAQEKLDLAFIWYNPTGTQELAWELFRNYDGKGGRFGDSSPVPMPPPGPASHRRRRTGADSATAPVAGPAPHCHRASPRCCRRAPPPPPTGSDSRATRPE